MYSLAFFVCWVKSLKIYIDTKLCSNVIHTNFVLRRYWGDILGKFYLLLQWRTKFQEGGGGGFAAYKSIFHSGKKWKNIFFYFFMSQLQ